jgi:hypothetical protein
MSFTAINKKSSERISDEPLKNPHFSFLPIPAENRKDGVFDVYGLINPQSLSENLFIASQSFVLRGFKN